MTTIVAGGRGGGWLRHDEIPNIAQFRNEQCGTRGELMLHQIPSHLGESKWLKNVGLARAWQQGHRAPCHQETSE